MSFSDPGSSPGGPVAFSQKSPWAPPMWDSFSDFVFHDFDSLKSTGQVFCRMSLNLSYLRLCHDWFGVVGSGDEVPVHHISEVCGIHMTPKVMPTWAAGLKGWCRYLLHTGAGLPLPDSTVWK